MIVVDKKIDPHLGTLNDYRHVSGPIIGINSKHFTDFTPICKHDLKRIDDEICILLAKTTLDKYPMVHGVVPPKLRERDLDAEFENTVLYNIDNNIRDIVITMNEMERRKYLYFKRKSIIPWFFILELKPNKFSTKTRDLYPWSTLTDNIPYTKSCIEALPFSEIGRVVIYGSWSDAHVPCHRDKPASTDFEHHINFNPGGYRPVYVYDSLNDEKHHLPESHKFYAYNTSDYHGVDSLPHFSYTVRVDGIYNAAALEIINS